MTRPFLLDTNHLAPLLMANSALWSRVADGRRAGIRFGTCVPVLCELEAGIQQTADPEGNRRALTRILRQVRVRPIELPLARVFGEIHLELLQMGRALSQVDRMLAALARQRNLTLLTSDRDFEALPDIRTENWLR
jgi:predicted nucleic acid-binding protein